MSSLSKRRGYRVRPGFGRFWRQSQELVRAGWDRAEQLEREQRLIAEQARLRERARIAQDMHGSLIGLLCQEHDEPSGTTSIPDLVARARRSGLNVTLLGHDGPTGAPPLVERARTASCRRR